MVAQQGDRFWPIGTIPIGLILLFCCRIAVGNEIRQPIDYFVMQALHSENVPNSVLASPKLRGIHIRDEWRLVEPTSNEMSFSWIDGQIARAKSFGKQVTLGVYTGNNSPSWLGAPLVDGVPIPWNPMVIDAHRELVIELGARYSDDAAIAAVHISAPATDDSLEMHFPTGLTAVPGYSDAAVINSWTSAIDSYAAAFPHNALVLNVGMVPDVNGAVTYAVIDYARQVLGPRANFIHCSLKASTQVDAPHHSTIVELGEQGARIGFEMVSPSIDEERFGGPFVDALEMGEQAGAAWYQVYQADVPLLPDNFPQTGDYNGNGSVDAADYTIWRDTFGSLANLMADGNRSGSVDLEDYDLWKQNFSPSSGGASGTHSSVFPTVIPEPTCHALVGIVLVMMHFTRIERRSCRCSKPSRNRDLSARH